MEDILYLVSYIYKRNKRVIYYNILLSNIIRWFSGDKPIQGGIYFNL